MSGASQAFVEILLASNHVQANAAIGAALPVTDGIVGPTAPSLLDTLVGVYLLRAAIVLFRYGRSVWRLKRSGREVTVVFASG